jgi:hypothetical protein
MTRSVFLRLTDVQDKYSETSQMTSRLAQLFGAQGI